MYLLPRIQILEEKVTRLGSSGITPPFQPNPANGDVPEWNSATNQFVNIAPANLFGVSPNGYILQWSSGSLVAVQAGIVPFDTATFGANVGSGADHFCFRVAGNSDNPVVTAVYAIPTNGVYDVTLTVVGKETANAANYYRQDHRGLIGRNAGVATLIDTTNGTAKKNGFLTDSSIQLDGGQTNLTCTVVGILGVNTTFTILGQSQKIID